MSLLQTPNISRQEDRPAIDPAIIVHDLGNLIQIAASAISIVTRTPDMPQSHSRPMLVRAQICLDHAGALVRQNIALARGRLEVATHSDVASCIADVAALLETRRYPGLTLGVDVEPDLPAIRCDPAELRRAVLKLALNACDAIDSSGIVILSAHQTGQSDAVEIRVIDNGIGMSAATMKRALDPRSTASHDGSDGTGLSMVELFVRNLDGEIAIEGEPGIGTTIILTLPAAIAFTAPIKETDR